LTLHEVKQITATVQSQTVRTQVAAVGEWFRWCERCEAISLLEVYRWTDADSFRERDGIRALRRHLASR